MWAIQGYIVVSRASVSTCSDEGEIIWPVMDKQFPTQSLVKLDKCLPRMEVGLSASTEWDRIVTPLQVEAWKKALVDYPDRELAEYVVRGIQLGVSDWLRLYPVQMQNDQRKYEVSART